MIEEKLHPFKLPDNFKLGTATSSLQIEGGDVNNSWYIWSEKNHIKDNSHCIRACEHWNRIDEDIKLINGLNSKYYRMSIEWARIEPSQGVYNHDALKHYYDEIKKLKQNNIEPLVTLHHFSNPIWLENKGGWLNGDVVRCFEEYVEFVVENLIDLVQSWVTINEPNVYLVLGYIIGDWPPGEKYSLSKFNRCAKNMIMAHKRAYEKIHDIGQKKGTEICVGVAHHLRVMHPKNNNFLDRFITKRIKENFNDFFVKSMVSDFLGINYYTRDMVGFTFNPLKKFVSIDFKTESMKNDLGWEIYPGGLYEVCREYYKKNKLPIFITENGVCDNNDRLRVRFIYDHLLEVKKLIDEGVDVRGYYHWSLMDNFEWSEGVSARFGLYHVDFVNQKRTIKQSGKFYAKLCKHNGITEDMINRFLI